jgi:hydroxymethylpyrimidine pyrophosphatase-like HAD family hydrolase
MAIVFLDLDGTVLDKGKPAEGIIETIALLKKNHHQPIIATGRVPHVFYGIHNTLGISDYIAANGQYIFYQNQVVYKKPIPSDVVERLVNFCMQKELDLVLETADDYVAIQKNSKLVVQFSDVYHID